MTMDFVGKDFDRMHAPHHLHLEFDASVQAENLSFYLLFISHLRLPS